MLTSQCLSGVISRFTRRFLNLQEFQSKELMNKYGLITQRFKIIEKASEAAGAAEELSKFALVKYETGVLVYFTLDAEEFVLKAQILAGGRGKGTFSSGLKGGVQLTKEVKKVQELVGMMLGHTLVTNQTGPDGSIVNQVMLAEAKDLIKETYVAVLLDRKIGGACLVVSPRGGVDIEQLAESEPHLIRKFPLIGKDLSEIFDEASRFLFPIEQEFILLKAKDQLERLFNFFNSVDATMVEINPFGLTPQGEVLCFDAKLEFDENASYRQSEIFKLSESLAEEDKSELLAKEHGLNYIKMNGNIGCLVNGAGLAMATMDLISLKGGKPANFLDVGGGASPAQIKIALEILLKDPQVSSILVNIFGGIMRCEIIAQGILAATRQINLDKPLIVRLSGTNAELGMKMLKESGIKMEVCLDAEDAADCAVKFSSGSAHLKSTYA